jgi:nitrogen-specific signal transduction histidine kinase
MKRIYSVLNTATNEISLIRAANTLQARNAAAKNTFQVSLATQDDLVSLVSAGCPVVDAVEATEPADPLVG